MKFSEFIKNAKGLTFSKLIQAVFFAWFIGLLFGSLINKFMPENLAQLYQAENITTQWIFWILLTVMVIFFLEGLIGMTDKKEGVKFGFLLGVFIYVYIFLSSPLVEISYAYLFVTFAATFFTTGALGFLLGKNR